MVGLSERCLQAPRMSTRKLRFYVFVISVAWIVFIVIQFHAPAVRDSDLTLAKTSDCLVPDYGVNSKFCKIPATDPLSLKSTQKLFGFFDPNCEPPHGRRAIYGTRIVEDRTCPVLLEDILLLDYGLSSTQINCSYIGFQQEDIVPDEVATGSLPEHLATRLSTDDCPDFDALWIECSLQNSSNLKQPLLLTKADSDVADSHVDDSHAELWNPLNVIVVGVSSLSRLAFLRTMPNTYQKMINLLDQRIQLYGYNRLGGSSAENRMPLLTGRPYDPASLPRNYFDNWTRYIWEDMADAGFVTLFAEDTPSRGLFTGDNKHGFLDFPTSLYPQLFLESIEKAFKNRSCVFGKPRAKFLLDYVFDAISIHARKRPFFAHVWLNQLTELNPSGALFLDETLSEFLDRLRFSGNLQSSILMLVSDQGFKNGPLAGTAQGLLEENLPLGFLLMPKLVEYGLNGHPVSLFNSFANSYRLVTPYDLHATILQLIGGKRSRSHVGVSIISSLIPKDRTCDDIRIPPQYCSCYKPRESPDLQLQEKLGEQMYNYINSKLQKLTLCARYSSYKASELEQLYEGAEATRIYKLKLQTEPLAKFEGFFEKAGKSFKPLHVQRLDKDSIACENRGSLDTDRNSADFCLCKP